MMGSYNFDLSAGIILVQAKIITPQMTTTARLVFDTGATFCMLPWSIVNQLKMDVNLKDVIQTTTASTVETSPMVTLPEMSVLGETAKNIRCIVRDLPPLSGVDGLLGISYLKYFQVRINFNRGSLDLKRVR